jgi:hypothetical protein
VIWLLLVACGEVRTIPTDADADADGWTRFEGDCADGDATVHPAAVETCNAADDDCDGAIDDADPNLAQWTWTDADGDGAAGTWGRACTPGVREDCDDEDPLRSPLAEEVPCDGVDDDCDGNGDDAGAAVSIAGHEHATFDDALAAAVAGDTLLVCPGTWDVNLVIPEELDALTIASASGSAADTILDGGDRYPVVSYEADGLTLDSLTLQNGAAYAGPLQGGGAVHCGRGPHDCALTVSSCELRDNAGDFGSVISLYHSTSLIVTGTTFEANVTTTGAAVYVLADPLEETVVSFSDVVFGPDQGGPDGSIPGAGTAVYVIAARDGELVARFDGVELSGQPNSRAGALAIGGQGDVVLDVVGGVLADNDVAIGFGAELDEADVRIEGTRIVRNGALGGAAMSATERARVESAGSDWGEGADDNLGPDLSFAGQTYEYGTSASFVCERWGTCE